MTDITPRITEGRLGLPSPVTVGMSALDGHIGKVDDATYDAGASCLVVDTGFWIFGKKRMIPAGTITAVDLTNNTLRVGMSKDQIKSAPDYDEAKRDREDYRNRQDEYYSGLR